MTTAARIIDGDPDLLDGCVDGDCRLGLGGRPVEAELDGEAERGVHRGTVTPPPTMPRHWTESFTPSEPERQPAIWQRQRDCWERALALGPTPVEHLRIPFGTGHPARHLLPCTGRRGERRVPAAG